MKDFINNKIYLDKILEKLVIHMLKINNLAINKIMLILTQLIIILEVSLCKVGSNKKLCLIILLILQRSINKIQTLTLIIIIIQLTNNKI
jgi:hypothetical protein